MSQTVVADRNLTNCFLSMRISITQETNEAIINGVNAEGNMPFIEAQVRFTDH